jgi:hypothetical protein
MTDEAAIQSDAAGELVLFGNEQTSLRIGRGPNGTFELVLSVHGEEITAYDLTAETVTTVGRKLLRAAACG